MFLITDMLYFPRRHRTSTCPLGWKLNALILVSRTFKTSSVLQCSRRLPVAITNKNTIHWSVPEMENSVFPDLVLLSCTPAATNSLSCPSLRSSYTATLSSTCFWLFLPSGIQSGEETDVGKQRLNRALESLSSLSLFSFSELNKALDTNKYNWWRVFIFLPQELQIRCDLSSARNILFARTKSNQSNKLPRLLWGLKQVLGTNLIPLRTKLVKQTKQEPAWPVINQLCFPCIESLK